MLNSSDVIIESYLLLTGIETLPNSNDVALAYFSLNDGLNIRWRSGVNTTQKLFAALGGMFD